MSKKKLIVILVAGLGVVYLLAGAVVALRILWWIPPHHAADAYVRALQEHDLPAVYQYAELLGPRLAGLMVKSNLAPEQRQRNWAKDYARWKSEFERGAKAMDSLRRERMLFVPGAKVVRVQVEHYRAEVTRGPDRNLVGYQDVPGAVHHVYYQFIYPDAERAPRVDVLDNIRTATRRRMRSVVLRLEVQRRPDVSWLKARLLEWNWLDELRFLYPYLDVLAPSDPSTVWMVGIRYDADKMTLETF